MTKYLAVIFDLDGVIVSTDELHYQAWKKVTINHNIPFDRNVNNYLRGVSRRDSLEIILQKANLIIVDNEKELILTEKNDLYVESLNGLSKADVDEDVLKTLLSLKASKIPMVIGSSSRNARMILKQIELMYLFDFIIDGTDIKESKPHPEVFLLGAEKLGYRPKNCLVVEDAISGIQAAYNGGFDSVAINDAVNSDKATYKIKNISEILDLIKL